MKETCEFRLIEEFADRIFMADEGKRLGDSVRQVVIPTDDPRFQVIGRLQLEIRATTGRSFYHGWRLHRRYSKAEHQAASLFRLNITSIFEPAGEECGTKYSETVACPHCGAGAEQITPLYLPEKRIPKGRAISQTIAGEIVVSRHVKDLFERNAITGASLYPVRFSPPKETESSEWFQLSIEDTNAEIIAPTRTGIDPFDNDERGECRCPAGDLIGLNLLSEVYIKSGSLSNVDIINTRQFVGTRRGLLRPERIVLISPKLNRLLESEKLKGVEVEVAYLL